MPKKEQVVAIVISILVLFGLICCMVIVSQRRALRLSHMSRITSLGVTEFEARHLRNVLSSHTTIMKLEGAVVFVEFPDFDRYFLEPLAKDVTKRKYLVEIMSAEPMSQADAITKTALLEAVVEFLSPKEQNELFFRQLSGWTNRQTELSMCKVLHRIHKAGVIQSTFSGKELKGIRQELEPAQAIIDSMNPGASRSECQSLLDSTLAIIDQLSLGGS